MATTQPNTGSVRASASDPSEAYEVIGGIVAITELPQGYIFYAYLESTEGDETIGPPMVFWAYETEKNKYKVVLLNDYITTDLKDEIGEDIPLDRALPKQVLREVSKYFEKGETND